jgi:hypothetical protein
VSVNVSVADPPLQIVVPPDSVIEGCWLTVTVTLFDVALQLPHVTTSVYVYVPALKPAGTV